MEEKPAEKLLARDRHLPDMPLGVVFQVKVTSSPSRLTRRELEIALHRTGDRTRQDCSEPDLQSAVGCRTIPRADGLASRIAAVRAHGVGRLRISAQDGAGSPGLFIRIVRGSQESAVFL
jgi:hypothetical protein